MSFSLLSVFVLSLLSVTAAIEIYRGINRGFMKTLISFATLIFSLILSIIFSPALGRSIAGAIYYNIAYSYEYREMIKGFEFVDKIVQPLAGIVISVVLFVVIFFIIRAVLGILMAIVYKKKLADQFKSVNKTPDDSWICRNDKVLSIVLGGLSAFVISMAIMSPIMGILNVTQDFINVATKWSSSYFQEEEVADIVDEIEKYTKDIPGNVLYYSGGQYIFRGIASVNYNGEHLSFMEELETVEETAEHFLNVYPVMMLGGDATEEHYQSIEMLCDSIMNVKICRPVLTFYGTMGADAWLKDYLIFKLPKPQLSQVVEPTFDELLRVCADSTDENIQMNIVTMLRIYNIFLETDMIELSDNADYKKILSILEENGAVDLLLDELQKNPYMKKVEESAQSIIVDLVAQEINSLEVEAETYGLLMGNIAEAMMDIKEKGYRTKEEQLSVMTSVVKEYIDDYGIQISDNIAEYTAEVIWNNFDEHYMDITEDDIRNFFAAYND